MHSAKRLRDAAKTIRATASELAGEARQIDALAMGRARALRLIHQADELNRVAVELEMLAGAQ